MNVLIQAALDRSRTVLLLLLMILTAGGMAYVSIPKEAAPDIDIPIFFVSVTYSGISPEDSERLLVRPLERELLPLAGLKELQARAGEGFALIRLDFEPGYDNRQALADVREQVDLVRGQLPPGTDEPQVVEVDLSMFPVLTTTLSGPVPERTLVRIARDLRDRLEALPGVLEVNIGGDREDVLEVMADPLVMETYRIPYQQLIEAIERNNRLVAAGAMDTGAGRVTLKVPGVIESLEDVLDLPVMVDAGTVVTFGDVATGRRTFKDPEGFARINGQPAVSLEIRKRAGANIIHTVDDALAVIEAARADWPEALRVDHLQNMADDIADLLGDLENNVILAIVLVMLTIVAALGGRSSWLVGLAIPGAFLGGILVIYLLGFTLNIVVLFSLILVVGILVDGAIVVVEQADRYLAEGMDRREAFGGAAVRMSWPIIASTLTTLAVFFPMLFWPGMVGEFMFFLPATVLVTLTASLLMALIFIPTLGSLVGARDASRPAQVARIQAAERGDFEHIDGFTARYVRLLRVLVNRPGQTFSVAAILVVAAYAVYGQFGRGVDFFPHVEPRFAQVQIQARGDLSVWEADALVRRVEQRLLDVPEIQTVYARTIGTPRERLIADYAEDVIGVIQLELIDWRLRPPAAEILSRLRAETDDLPGVILQFREQERGPREGKPIQVEVSGRDVSQLSEAVARLRDHMDRLGGFVDVEDDRSLPGVELRVEVDHREAARYGADIGLLGNAVQMLTQGIRLGGYRPDDADEEVDIRVRFPFDERNLAQLVNLRVPTAYGLVPINNFVDFRPAPKTGIIKRVDGRRSFTVTADAAAGLLVDHQVRRLQAAIAEDGLPEGVEIRFRGQAEEQAEALGFLELAFVLAVFLMFVILVTQFNSLYQAVLVLSAIVFSTAGVLLGLILRQEPFGIVMSGVGVIALAGIVVNNNIVLIDTYNVLRRQGLDRVEAALRTGAQRLRPVLLTSITTILGLLPMVLGLTVDFTGRDFSIGAPSTQYWVQLATAISGGLLVATPLTLLVTPVMLAWGDRRP
ncbi:MFS transporter [Thioalkalivibrio denitrificans]|uniref:MFS transporter n=1 Tax=Thioalkalivibrio denitrificans TaxID=108003 RepID=A0A1V3NIR9_9GAMM|nr:efflux RND transporter permease subunit [Thioalkalivibrio denitrificans]OOG24778.1 MFS transporter [Thioalkalivibrio denitrificans]